MDNCIFCKIASGQIPVAPLAENDSAILIKDKNPMAPHHVLCISKDHYANINEPNGMDMIGLMANMFQLLQNYTEEAGLDKTGHRIIINTGSDGGQTVQHLHIHLLGGAPLKNDFGA